MGSPLVGGSNQETITLVSSLELVVGAVGESGAEAAIISRMTELALKPTELRACTQN